MMGKIQVFEINFDHRQAVFLAGSVVRGTVKLELKDAMKMREISPLVENEIKNEVKNEVKNAVLSVAAWCITLRMTCLGRAHVHWSEVENVGHRGGRQRLEAVEHSAEEEYFQFRFQLWPPDNNIEDANNPLPAGQHTFPFQLQLPQELPPSFEGAYGFIRYWAKATIDKPWKFDQHTKRAFTVIPSLDLNQQPDIEEPIQYRGELRTGCCCLPSGRFSGSVSTNRKGFVPGSEIGISSQIENHTGSTCWAEVRLKMHITYLASGKFKQERKVISTVCREQIPRGKNYIWNERMRIPPLPPSHLKGCKLMNSKYILQFRVGSDARCSWDEIEFEDEIIIGTLPFLTKQRIHPLANANKSVNMAVPVAITAQDKEMDRATEGKPSYEECMLFGRVNIKDKDDTEHTVGEMIFTPLYAFYSPRTPIQRASSFIE